MLIRKSHLVALISASFLFTACDAGTFDLELDELDGEDLAQADPPFDLGEQLEDIWNGSPAADRNVVQVRTNWRRGSQTAGFRCTGTLIRSKIVLTAAHCNLANDGWSFIEGAVAIGARPPFEQVIPIVGAVQHPGYINNPVGGFVSRIDQLSSNDLLVLKLASAPANVTPAQLYTGSALPANKNIRFVGYGASSADHESGGGVRRQGTMKTVNVAGANNVQVALRGPSATRRGDSGGPGFAGGKIVTLTSTGGDETNGTPWWSAGPHIGRHAGWINAAANSLGN